MLSKHFALEALEMENDQELDAKHITYISKYVLPMSFQVRFVKSRWLYSSSCHQCLRDSAVHSLPL
jgi:hypothetical protein